PEAAEADLFLQPERAGQLQQVIPTHPLAEDIEGQGPPTPLRFCQGSQHEAMVLDKVKIADRDQIAERLSVWLDVQRSHEITDDRIWDRRGFRQPAHECISRPPGHGHQAVNLRDYLALDLTNPPEHRATVLDQLLVGPFVRLGDSEVDRHYHALVWP